MEKEIWKDLPGYPGQEISSYGRLYGKKYKKMRKQQVDKDGYYVTGLSVDNKLQFRRINRLVAEAFIPNPDNLPFVNHKDEDKKNNHIENLEWCTGKQNRRYSLDTGVVQLTMDGEFVQEFETITDAGAKYGIPISHIQDCCANKKHYKSYQGYQWVYKKEYDPQKDYKGKKFVRLKQRKRKID